MSNLELLTVVEAAQRLSVSRMTVTRMARDGRLATVRERPYLFTAAEVERAKAKAAA